MGQRGDIRNCGVGEAGIGNRTIDYKNFRELKSRKFFFVFTIYDGRMKTQALLETLSARLIKSSFVFTTMDFLRYVVTGASVAGL